MMFKCKTFENVSIKTYGCITVAADDSVTLKLYENVNTCCEGKHVSVGIPIKRETASGNTLNVLDIIAYGNISNVEQDVIKIQSNKNSSLIAKRTLSDCVGKVCELVITMLDNGGRV